MRVMHVITNMMGSGGAEVMLLRLARVACGERPVIVSLMDVADRHRRLISEHDIDVRPLKVRSTIGMMKAVPLLGRMIRDVQPDVVMCWLYHAMIVGQLAKWWSRTDVPVFWNVRQSLDDVGSLSTSTRVALRASRLLSGRPAGIVFNSARAFDLHMQFGYRNSNCIVIPNGFDHEPSSPQRVQAPKVLGIAGRLHPQKDYGTFFAAAARARRTHTGVRFVAAGAGVTPDNETVRRMIAAAGLPFDAVELRGNVLDMKQFYRDIDALVLSSRTEGFPNVLAEAMSFGKPVISTDVGDAATIVGDTGFIVPPGDAVALADAIRRMLDLEPPEYAALSAAAKDRIDRTYSLPHVAGLYQALFAKVQPSRQRGADG